MADKRSLALMRKYYLPYKPNEKLSPADIEELTFAGVFVPVTGITHDDMILEIKRLAERITLTEAAKGFLYSLSTGDTRYHTALSSLVWAKALPIHEPAITTASRPRREMCAICGCTHGLHGRETVDWNEYGVFRYLPPIQYGRKPDLTSAEYVLNDLRAFVKLPPAEPCDKDYDILNAVFGAVRLMKPHNMDTALVSEIRSRKLIDASGNAIHCLLAVLSICGIFQSSDHEGFLHRFDSSGLHRFDRDGLTFYPLYFWRGKDGVNYAAFVEVFGAFCGGRLAPDRAAQPDAAPPARTAGKMASKAEQYYADGRFIVTLTNEERRYLALDDFDPAWEYETFFSVTNNLHKRTLLYYEGNTIVKVIYEEIHIDRQGAVFKRLYNEYDTRLATEERKLLRPLTERGRAKPVTPSNVMAVKPFGCEFMMEIAQDKCLMWVGNRRNCQEVAIGEGERIKDIRSDDDFHAFMRYYMSTCPDNYFDRIAEVRSMPFHNVRYSAGDVFRCQTDRTHFTYGLIIGRTREIEKWDELPPTHSFRLLLDQPILVRMYDLVTTDAHMTPRQLAGKPLRPSKLYSDADIIRGRHMIIGHKDLEPDDIQFQINLARQTKANDLGPAYTAENRIQMAKVLSQTVHSVPRKDIVTPTAACIEWGFASCQLPWDKVPDALKDMLATGRYFNIGVGLGISGNDCGKSFSQLLAKAPGHHLQFNLLIAENREKFGLVMNALGLPADCTYDDFAEKFGGLTRQQYIDLLNARASGGKEWKQ